MMLLMMLRYYVLRIVNVSDFWLGFSELDVSVLVSCGRLLVVLNEFFCKVCR